MPAKVEFNQKGIIFILLMAVSVLAWHYFFVQLNLSVNDFTDLLGYGQLLEKALTMEFVLFLILFPVTLAIGMAGTKLFDAKTAKIFGILGVILGELIAIALYPQLLDLAIVGVFYVVGIFLCIETAAMKENEVKKFAGFRISNSALTASFSAMGIGILIFGAITTYAINPQLVENFEEKLLKGDLVEGVNLSELSADVVIQTQQQSYQELVNLSQFQKLQQKSDPDVQEFVLVVKQTAQVIASPEYKKQVMNELEKQQKEAQGDKTPLETLKEGIPALQQFEEFYWAMITLIIFGVFTLVSGIVWKPLGIVYGIIALKVAENMEKK